MKQNATEQILTASRQEFMKKGFKDASLRTIAQMAGVTTGAVYAHYPDKEALFTALVEPIAGDFLKQFSEAQAVYAQMPLEEQIGQMFIYSTETIRVCFDVIYEHFVAFRLLICCSAGTVYEDYLHQLIEMETESTRGFMKRMEQEGRSIGCLNDELIHILAQAFFTSLFECVVHNMEKEEALQYVSGLNTFFNAGWKSVLGW